MDSPGIAAAIVVNEGAVLMIRRRVEEGQLSWQFPAGKIEAGESVLAAAERETREETGLVVVATALLGARVHPHTGRHVSYVACESVAGTARVASPREVAEVAWLTYREIPDHVPSGLFEPVREYLDSADSARSRATVRCDGEARRCGRCERCGTA